MSDDARGMIVMNLDAENARLRARVAELEAALDSVASRLGDGCCQCGMCGECIEVLCEAAGDERIAKAEAARAAMKGRG